MFWKEQIRNVWRDRDYPWCHRSQRQRVSQESEQCHIQTQGKKTLDVLKCHPEQERYPSGHVRPSHRFREIN